MIAEQSGHGNGAAALPVDEASKVNSRLALGMGRIAPRSDRTGLRALFDAEGWLLWDDAEIRHRLEA